MYFKCVPSRGVILGTCLKYKPTARVQYKVNDTEFKQSMIMHLKKQDINGTLSDFHHVMENEIADGVEPQKS